MAITKTKVQNLAIVLVGAKTLVTDADATKAARLVADLWDMSYQGMLVLPHNWRFATTRVQLTATTAPTIGHYDYRYLLPPKCLRVIAQIDLYDDNVEYEHRIENFVDSDQVSHPCLVTDESSCYIKYIHDLGQDNEVGRWPAWFARIVALDLAIQMSEPLKQDKLKQNQLITMMATPVVGWMDRAIQANAMEDMDTSDDDLNLDRGNTDVLDASADAETDRNYIVERE